MSLFSIETVPVLLNAETYIGDKREYTQIIPETQYIALTDNNYVPFLIELTKNFQNSTNVPMILKHLV